VFCFRFWTSPIVAMVANHVVLDCIENSLVRSATLGVYIHLNSTVARAVLRRYVAKREPFPRFGNRSLKPSENTCSPFLAGRVQKRHVSRETFGITRD
jgi:hypothetical protein